MDPDVDQDTRALAASLVEHAKRDGVILAVAESCTGGLVGAAITSVPGASEIFWGGVIAYHNDVKSRSLGVTCETISDSGAVSQQCAAEMAIGAREITRAGRAVSITGIAGPGGGSPDKPVGTVWIAVSDACEQQELCVQYRYPHDAPRDEIRVLAARSALKLLLERWELSTHEHEHERLRVP